MKGNGRNGSPAADDSRLLRKLSSGTFAFNRRKHNSPEISGGIAINELDAVGKLALACAYLRNYASRSFNASTPMPHREGRPDEEFTAYLNGSAVAVQVGCVAW